MIKGIGIDIVEIDRIKKSILKYEHRFLDKIYTPSEQQYCEGRSSRYPHYAVRFAGKEAMLKALGTGLRENIRWRDIEFINDALGKPMLLFHGKLAQAFAEMHVKDVHVSFSHSRDHAVAMAVLEI